jgi:hypothetical protein
MKWFWRFSIAIGEGKFCTNHQIYIFGFEPVAKDIEGWLKFCTSYL